MPRTLYDVMLELMRDGLFILPVGKERTTQGITKWPIGMPRPTPENAKEWCANPLTVGIAFLCGAPSDNLEVLDVETNEAFLALQELTAESGLLFGKYQLPIIVTPHGGRHVYYRLHDPVKGVQHLAYEEDGKSILIETRGERCLVTSPYFPPKHTHEGNGYKTHQGSVRFIPRITKEEHEILMNASRQLDRSPIKTKHDYAVTARVLLPGVEQNNICWLSWDDLLKKFHYTKHSITEDGITRWLRPGQQGEPSVTVNFQGRNQYYDHSSNSAPFTSKRFYTSTEAEIILSGGNLSTEVQLSHVRDFDDTYMLERFDAIFGQWYKYDKAIGWLRWNGKFFEEIGDDQVLKCVQFITRTMNEDLTLIKREGDKEVVKNLLKQIKSYRNVSKINAVTTMMQRSERAAANVGEKFDQEEFLLNCRNGVVDLRTGEIRDHSPDYKFTHITSCAADINTGCPAWKDFISFAFDGKQDIMDAFQEVCGSALLGSARYKILPFIVGPKNTGKSTVLIVLQSILDSFARTVDKTSLSKAKQSHIRDDLAVLRGTRLCTINEVDKLSDCDTSLLKTLSGGGDSITASRKYKSEMTFVPKCTLILVSNFPPTLPGDDGAIWDRIQIFAFDQPISRVALNFIEDELKPEFPGILWWLIEGCMRLLQRGHFVWPQEMLDRRTKIRSEADPIQQFVNDHSTSTYGASAGVVEAYAAYKEFCAASGVSYPKTRSGFVKHLEVLGIPVIKDSIPGIVITAGVFRHSPT